MNRTLSLLILSTVLLTLLSGCLVIDKHRHGAIPPGQAKKMKH